MKTDFRVNLKAVFPVVVALKIVCSFIAWYMGDLWLFGVAIPLTLMAGYIGLGLFFRGDGIPAEKFADSCYYLGFIFTIFSIILCLFDLPNIGDDLYSIAVRFGVAMISTVFGLAVRVGLVSFRHSVDDVVQNVEDTVFSVSNQLTDEFGHALEALQKFRGDVFDASQDTIRQVALQLKEFNEQHIAQMHAFYEENQKKQNEAMLSIISDIKVAAAGLSSVVKRYETSSETSLERIEGSVEGFVNKLIQNLDAVTFPSDLFVKKLDASFQTLGTSAEEMNEAVRKISNNIYSSARSVEKTIAQLNMKSESLTEVIDMAHELSNQQAAMLKVMTAQQEGISQNMKDQQGVMTEQIERQHQSMEKHLATQQETLSGIANSFTSLEHSMEDAASLIKSSEAASTKMLELIETAHKANQASTEALTKTLSPLAETLSPLPELISTSHAQIHADQESTREAFMDVLKPLNEVFAKSHIQGQQVVELLKQGRSESKILESVIQKSLEMNETYLQKTMDKVMQVEQGHQEIQRALKDSHRVQTHVNENDSAELPKSING